MVVGIRGAARCTGFERGVEEALGAGGHVQYSVFPRGDRGETCCVGMRYGI